MDRELIIQLAQEAGLEYSCQDGWTSPTPENKYAEGVEQEPLERFAALVAAHEREECAKIVDDWYNSLASEPEMAEIAAEIRSRT